MLLLLLLLCGFNNFVIFADVLEDTRQLSPREADVCANTRAQEAKHSPDVLLIIN